MPGETRRVDPPADLPDELPLEGDAEEHEQEGEFGGHGYEGSWRVVKNPTDCPVVAVFVVLGGER